MRGHAIGKASRHHGATINCSLMLGNLQASRGQVEHLTLLDPLHRKGALTGAAMRRLMPFDKVVC